MGKQFENSVKNINKYLGNFKDAEGNPPDEIKVAVLVEKYCTEYNKFN